jgi:hypothetical protein
MGGDYSDSERRFPELKFELLKAAQEPQVQAKIEEFTQEFQVSQIQEILPEAWPVGTELRNSNLDTFILKLEQHLQTETNKVLLIPFVQQGLVRYTHNESRGVVKLLQSLFVRLKKVQNFQRVLVPLYLAQSRHFQLAEISADTKTIYIYCSLNLNTSNECYELLLEWAQFLFPSLNFGPVLVSVNVPQQLTNDCGVHVLLHLWLRAYQRGCIMPVIEGTTEVNPEFISAARYNFKGIEDKSISLTNSEKYLFSNHFLTEPLLRLRTVTCTNLAQYFSVY